VSLNVARANNERNKISNADKRYLRFLNIAREVDCNQIYNYLNKKFNYFN